MTNKDQNLLQEAYSTIVKSNLKSTEDNAAVEDITDTTPLSEPAPNVQVGAAKVVDVEPNSEITDDLTIKPSANSVGLETQEAELEEDEMVIDNLNSIRESIMKTASFCASGGHLEPWQQQKLAIAMDNLASIARSLNSGCKC